MSGRLYIQKQLRKGRSFGEKSAVPNILKHMKWYLENEQIMERKREADALSSQNLFTHFEQQIRKLM